MTTLQKVAFTAIIGLGLIGTSASADTSKGKKIYMKKLKGKCGFTGAIFAQKHTQAEWEDAKANGKLGELMMEACPGGKEFFESKKFKKKYSKHLYDFVHDYAKDSGNVPSC